MQDLLIGVNVIVIAAGVAAAVANAVQLGRHDERLKTMERALGRILRKIGLED
ncbi:MAG: hypothetical protein AMXMBFR77_28590 [Phycisphaerales bacterium]